MRVFAILISLGLLSAVPQAALAQEQDASPQRTEAAMRFERGVEFYNAGALAAALVEFERAYELVSDYRVLFNIARVHVEQNHYVEGVRAYERYLEEGGDQLSKARRTQAEQELEVLRARIGSVTVRSNVAGAELSLNGKTVGTLPLSEPIELDPGTWELRLEKPGYRPVQRTLKLAAGDSPRITLKLTAQTTTPETTTVPAGTVADASPPPRFELTPNYTAFGATLAGAVLLAGGAGTFGYLASERESELETAFNEFPADRNQVDTLRTEGKTFATVSDVMTVGAIVTAGLSLYFLFDPPTDYRSAADTGGLRFDLLGDRAALRAQF